jgi:hypothetical protein
MSCWCDGDDPGCKVCHPAMSRERRDTARALQRVTRELLATVAENAGSIPLVKAAHDYRVALEAYRRAHGL